MRIKLIHVGGITKEAKYSYFPLTYSKDGKEEKPKKIMSFDEKAFGELKNASPGEEFDVTLKKDDNGYWKWVEVVKAVAGSTPAQPVSKGSTYETPEERARRQVLIVRQSSLAQAVAFSAGMKDVLIDDVLERASQFEDWVNRE